MSEPAGWYGNPDGSETQRYWDGVQWTHDVRPLPAPTGFDPSRTEAAGPGPAPIVGAQAPAEASFVAPAGQSASFSDLVGILFDFAMARAVTPALAKLGYRVGAISILIVSILFLVGGLQAGGLTAVVSVLLFPLLALLWLIALRMLCQALVDGSAADGHAEAG